MSASTNTAQAGTQTRNVHELRVAAKKLRAVLRLLGPQHLEHAEQMNNSLRAVGRKLSPARDAAARAKWLENHGFEAPLPASPTPAIAPLRQELELTRGRILAELPKIRKKAVKKNLLRCEEKLRKAGKRAAKNKDPEHFHEWRKRAKDYFYQLELTEREAPRRLEKLTRLLGRAQDCALIEAADLPEEIKRVASKERKRLWKKALRTLQ